MLALLLVMSVHADKFDATNLGLEASYITLVDEDGPVTNVLNAANFAATMTALDVTFTGLTVNEARDQLTKKGVENSLLVYFDENRVTLYKGTRGTIPEVADAAEGYLNDQGFSVASVGPLFEVNEPVAQETKEREEPEVEEPEPVEEERVEEEILVDEEPQTNPPTIEAEAEPVVPEPEEEIEEPEPEEPGIIAKIWRWIIKLF